MTETVVPLAAGRGIFLASVDFYRMPDGAIRAELRDIGSDQIEAVPTITARFCKVADWMLLGVADLLRQAVRFDEETRQSERG